MGRNVKKVKESTKDILKARKREGKEKLKEKRARLIIRNLPFKTTEEDLRKHFESFGEINNVTIIKNEDDSKLKGFGFVQFKLVQKAAKARHHLNNKPFMGRELSVDFALSKSKYEKNKKVPDMEIKTEVKEEVVDVGESVGINSEDQEPEIMEVETSESEATNNEASGSEDEKDLIIEEKPEKVPFKSNDVTEGKTVFIKNVPFSATNDDLKQVMQQFGPVYYALICVDKFTEHSKGTAFVKFRFVEDAEKALEAGTELTLNGQILDCHKALAKNEIQQKSQLKQEEKSKPKDSRNLYLVKEGVILAGTKAAESVSASDMAKRLQLEQYKTQMLRNLNMFVSRERLVIHNLPANFTDQKLRDLCRKNTNNAVIREAKIMRDYKNVDANGIGRSKEFGFVTFTKHENALLALRNLNNNPNVFSIGKRPIVSFSIENRAKIRAKLKRLEMSKDKISENTGNDLKSDKTERFAGVTAKPGKQKMRTRYNLKTQAKLHHENLKNEKKKQKFAKKSLKEKQKDFRKQSKQKINNKKENDNFSKLVEDYKRKLNPQIGKIKWDQQ